MLCLRCSRLVFVMDINCLPSRLCQLLFFGVVLLAETARQAVDAKSHGGYTLTILHTNDVHARFDESNPRGSFCHATDAVCYGGVARRSTAVKRLRQKYDNVVLLDAGDQYQGTMWFNVHKGKAAAHFMNKLQYDVMTLGNHEFDNSVPGLVPFMIDASFPIVSSNIDAGDEPEMVRLFNKSTVLDVGGERIGVVGYITAETAVLSSTGKLRFLDEVKSVQAEVNRLIGEGVNKIIALGHAGIDVDRRIASKVRGVDVVIGGHTNTFLYTGKVPSSETAEDVYPIAVVQPNNDRVLVAQAYAFGKYLGFLQVTFDDVGRVTNWTGNPILMDNKFDNDPEIVDEMHEWRAPIEAMYSRYVGVTANKLGDFMTCRMEECTFGNMMANAMIQWYQRSNSPISDVHIAVLNGGSIRTTIDEGNVTYADVMEAFPFGVTIDVVELLGSDLRRVLEHSVKDYNPCVRHGKFLQVGGLRVTYDLTRPNGQRVGEVTVNTSSGHGTSFVPLDDVSSYKVIMSSFLVRGGDGYSMIAGAIKQHYNLGIVDADAVVDYFKHNSPVDVQIEGRIRFVPPRRAACAAAATSRDSSASSSSSTSASVLIYGYSLVFAALILHRLIARCRI